MNDKTSPHGGYPGTSPLVPYHNLVKFVGDARLREGSIHSRAGLPFQRAPLKHEEQNNKNLMKFNKLHTKPCTWEEKTPGSNTGWSPTTCKATMLETTWGPQQTELNTNQ